MVINLGWRPDVYLSDRALLSRTDNWADAMFDNLRQMVLAATSWVLPWDRCKTQNAWSGSEE